MAKESFEEKLQKLANIVSSLESGDVPLDKALKEFTLGVKLSNHLQDKLAGSQTKLAKVMTSNGKEVPYKRDKNGKDINNSVSNDTKQDEENVRGDNN